MTVEGYFFRPRAEVFLTSDSNTNVTCDLSVC